MPIAETGYLGDVVVILLAAVVFVSVFQRLRLSPILGYLVAGAIIGPFGFALVRDIEATRILAELGVVFLLFTVGLELPLERIKLLRLGSFALGIAQIGLTGLVVAAAVVLAGGELEGALIIGGGLALSSTAVVLELLADRDELKSRFGRSTFTVLLTQDLAVGPLLVLVYALGRETMSLPLAIGFALLGAAVAFAAIFFVGRLVLRPLFDPVAATKNPEVFAALTLLVVLVTGLVTRMAGLSMAFGAFLAGLLLAETRHRHQAAAVIRPFRGLLLGLFFMTVGMSIDTRLVIEEAAFVLLLLVALLLGKAILLAGLCRLFGFPSPHAFQTGVWLCQGGEFAFILFQLGMEEGVVAGEVGRVLIVVVALSMLLTPLLAEAGRRIARRWEEAAAVGVDRLSAAEQDFSDHVVIAGFGRVGVDVGRELAARGVPFVAVDLDPRRVARAREEKLPVFYGDETLPEILEGLCIDRARAFVVALDDPKATVHVVALVRYIFPELTIVARAQDGEHARELETAGATRVVPELMETGRLLAGTLLAGNPPHRADDEPRS